MVQIATIPLLNPHTKQKEKKGRMVIQKEALLRSTTDEPTQTTTTTTTTTTYHIETGGNQGTSPSPSTTTSIYSSIVNPNVVTTTETSNNSKEDVVIDDKQMEAIDQVNKNLTKTTPAKILLIGPSGAGKSSICNSIFRKDIFKVGQGKSVTDGFQVHKIDMVEIHDSRGVEVGEDKNAYMKNVLQYIQQNQISVLWIVVDGASGRFQEFMVKDLLERVKKQAIVYISSVLITKCDKELTKKQELKKHIEGIIPSDIEVFLTSRYFLEPSNCPFCKSKKICGGLDDEDVYDFYCRSCKKEWNLKDEDPNQDLLAACLAKLPLEIRISFLTSIGKTDNRTRIILSAISIGSFATANTITAASPLPFSDWPLLLIGELAMIASLAAIWNVPIKNNAKLIVTSALATVGVPFTVGLVGGKIASSLLKFIPGMGSAVGAVLDGSIALTLTAFIGIYSCTIFAIVQKKCKDKEITDEIFKECIDMGISGEVAEQIKTSLKEGKPVRDVLTNALQSV